MIQDWPREGEFKKSFLEFVKGNLFNEEDLFRIIDLAFQHNNQSVLEELAFHAKYLKGLMRIIKNKDNSLDEEYFAKIKTEYGGHIEKIKEKFRIITEPGSDFVKEIFEKKYLAMTRESLEHLNKLCEDLGKLKSFLNNQKEIGKGF